MNGSYVVINTKKLPNREGRVCHNSITNGQTAKEQGGRNTSVARKMLR